MKQIIEYLKDNTVYLWVFLGVVAGFLLIFFLIKFLTGKSKKNKQETADAPADNSNLSEERAEANDSRAEKEISAEAEENAREAAAEEGEEEISPAAETAPADTETPLKTAEPAEDAENTAEKVADDETKSQKPAKKTETAKPKAEDKAAKPQEGGTAAKTESEREEPVKYAGRWRIFKTNDGYVASLYASNGVLMLNSEPYASLNGAKGGIETIKKNVTAGTFTVKEDKHGYFNFRLVAPNRRVVCIGESYDNRYACESALESFKKFALNSSSIEISGERDEDK